MIGAGRLVFAVLALGATCGPDSGPSGPATVPPQTRSVELGPGDVVDIRVTDQEDLSGEYEVDEDGTIRFPWIGDIEVIGRTKGEIAETIEEQLASGWLRQPQVFVRVVERQNREVSVLGQVNEPGSFAYKERLTLVQAISLAGGLNPLAQAKKVQLTRETAEGRQTYVIDVRQILESKQADMPLLPGDIVFVPESPI
ncbi:MAG: polysaccharide biosynthesis/export family protein [Nannocystaceae bacterium]